jgi:protein TonB
MKTQLLTVSPAVVRVNRQTPADTIRSSQTEPPPRHDSPDDSYPQGPSQKPDWHYDPSEKPTRMTFVVGLLLSGGLHAYALWGFNDPAPEVIEPVETEFEITFMEMPPIEDLDDPADLFDANEQQEEVDPGQYVPMQADIPAFNSDAVLVQRLDLHSLLPRPDFDSAKVVSIPPRISRSPMRPAEIKDLFNLEDLDEEPTPLLQRPPEFRYKYKHTVKYAEVVVDFIVDNKGKVSWAVVRSSTHEGFKDAAILGVSRWQFKPGKKKGRAVNTRMRVPLRFRITE